MTMSTEITTSETPNHSKRKTNKKAKAAKTAKRAAKATKSAKARPSSKPKDTKKERVLELLRRKEGATIAELADATDCRITASADSLAGRCRRRWALRLNQ